MNNDPRHPHDNARRATITVPEAAALLGVSESTVYEAAARGEIPVLRIGGRVLVLRDRFMELLQPPAAAA